MLAFVLTVMLMLLQVRPPEPVEPPRSMVRLLQDPIDVGMVITTTGFAGDDGAVTLIALELTVSHVAQTAAVTAAGQAARTTFGSTLNDVPTLTAVEDELELGAIETEVESPDHWHIAPLIPENNDEQANDPTVVKPPRFVAALKEAATTEPSALNVADCSTGVAGVAVTAITEKTFPLLKPVA